MFLMQQSYVQWRIYWNLLCNTRNLVSSSKIWKIKILFNLTRYLKLPVWVWKIIKTYIIVTWWVNTWLQFDLKWATLKYLTYNFADFWENQCQNLWEKLLFGQFFVSLPFPLLTMLRKTCYRWSVRNIVWGERGNFKNFLKLCRKLLH